VDREGGEPDRGESAAIDVMERLLDGDLGDPSPSSGFPTDLATPIDQIAKEDLTVRGTEALAEGTPRARDRPVAFEQHGDLTPVAGVHGNERALATDDPKELVQGLTPSLHQVEHVDPIGPIDRARS
jgi:hypothetical protein